VVKGVTRHPLPLLEPRRSAFRLMPQGQRRACSAREKNTGDARSNFEKNRRFKKVKEK
jgi:hypothetical protein